MKLKHLAWYSTLNLGPNFHRVNISWEYCQYVSDHLKNLSAHSNKVSKIKGNETIAALMKKNEA